MKRFKRRTNNERGVTGLLCRKLLAMTKGTTSLLLLILLSTSLFAQGTPGLQFTLIEGGTAYEVSRGTATATVIEIPAMHGSLPVTGIANNGFAGFSAMTQVIMPNSIVRIGFSAFVNCTGLTAVTIPNSVTTIRNRAFDGCTNLATVNFPTAGNLTDIEVFAFRNCISLTSVTIPNTVTYIGWNPWVGCFGLNTITVAAGNPRFAIRDNALVRILDGELITAMKTTTTIHSTVQSIGYSAFMGLTHLTSITIPVSVSLIHISAFENCTNLATVTFAAGSILNTIRASAFRYCTALTSIVIPRGVAIIDDSAFRGCTSLEQVSFATPSVLFAIGETAFRDCTTLTSITFPPTLRIIGDRAFMNCENLTSVTLPNTFERIGDEAFKNTGLTIMSLPYTVNYVGIGAFEDCKDLATFGFGLGISLMAIPERMFKGCISLVSIILPHSIQMIGDSAFEGCTSLVTVAPPVGNSSLISQIGDSAFKDCVNLSSLPMLNMLNSLGDYAFQNCESLVSFSFSLAITHIGEGAFWGCTSLESVLFPSQAGITTIAAGLFRDCSSLKSIHIPDAVLSIGDWAFFGCHDLETVTFGEGSLLNEVGRGAFTDCYSLKNIVLPHRVATIGVGAFSSCVSLEEFIFPSSLRTIESNAFLQCQSLKNVVLSNQVSYIGANAFWNCVSLESVILTRRVTTIGAHAFASCTSLEYILIPDSVENLGANAFYNGTSMTIYVESTPTENWHEDWYKSDTGVEVPYLLNTLSYPPRNLTAVLEDGQVKLAWDCLDPEIVYHREGIVIGYHVFRNGANITNIVDETEFIDTRPEIGYNTYTVAAIFTSWSITAHSNEVTINTLVPAFPYYENFESYAIGENAIGGWIGEHLIQDTPIGNNPTKSIHTFVISNSPEGSLVSPPIGPIQPETVLKFDYRAMGSVGGTGTLRLKIGETVLATLEERSYENFSTVMFELDDYDLVGQVIRLEWELIWHTGGVFRVNIDNIAVWSEYVAPVFPYFENFNAYSIQDRVPGWSGEYYLDGFPGDIYMIIPVSLNSTTNTAISPMIGPIVTGTSLKFDYRAELRPENSGTVHVKVGDIEIAQIYFEHEDGEPMFKTMTIPLDEYDFIGQIIRIEWVVSLDSGNSFSFYIDNIAVWSDYVAPVFPYFEDFNAYDYQARVPGWAGYYHLSGSPGEMYMSLFVYSNSTTNNVMSPMIGPIVTGTVLKFDYQPMLRPDITGIVHVKVGDIEIAQIYLEYEDGVPEFQTMTIPLDVYDFIGEIIRIEWAVTLLSGHSLSFFIDNIEVYDAFSDPIVIDDHDDFLENIDYFLKVFLKLPKLTLDRINWPTEKPLTPHFLDRILFNTLPPAGNGNRNDYPDVYLSIPSALWDNADFIESVSEEFDLLGVLEFEDDTYYIMLVNIGGDTRPGAVTLLSPTNGATGVSTEQVLSWQVAEGTVTGYRVFFGTTLPNTPTAIVTNGTSFAPTLANNTTYYWRVVAYNESGNGDSSATWWFRTGTVSDDDIVDVVFVTGLKGNFPNPFNPETRIQFSIGNVGNVKNVENVKIEVFNLRGQKVRSLVNEYLPAGEHSVTWDGRDENGRNVSSGVYFYRMRAGEYTETRRMVLMK